MEFARYAIYYAPPPGAGWARFATSWLGWDMQAGGAVAHPDVGLELDAIADAPRRYGLHATLKPPFRLADGVTREDLERAVADLGQTLAPVPVGPLRITRLGRFLALCPARSEALAALAGACVREPDHLRRPLEPGELARRRKSHLTERQERHLVRWGYPYVMEDFRLHITLTGRLGKGELAEVQAVLEDRLGPMLPDDLVIGDLALVGEDREGRFHLLSRYPLAGS